MEKIVKEGSFDYRAGLLVMKIDGQDLRETFDSFVRHSLGKHVRLTVEEIPPDSAPHKQLAELNTKVEDLGTAMKQDHYQIHGLASAGILMRLKAWEDATTETEKFVNRWGKMPEPVSLAEKYAKDPAVFPQPKSDDDRIKRLEETFCNCPIEKFPAFEERITALETKNKELSQLVDDQKEAYPLTKAHLHPCASKPYFVLPLPKCNCPKKD